MVSFGQERVPESVEILSFYAPHGGFLFLALGHSPVALEVPTSARLVRSSGGGFGPEFEGPVPLVETVPGANDASVESLTITLGTAIRVHHRPVYYGTVPRTCPKGGFMARAALTFAADGNPATPEVVSLPVHAPCPRS